MNDFELMGFPYALVIGKGLESNDVEFIQREGLTKELVKTDELMEILKKKVL